MVKRNSGQEWLSEVCYKSHSALGEGGIAEGLCGGGRCGPQEVMVASLMWHTRRVQDCSWDWASVEEGFSPTAGWVVHYSPRLGGGFGVVQHTFCKDRIINILDFACQKAKPMITIT